MNQPSPRPKWEHCNNGFVWCRDKEVGHFTTKEYMDQAIRAVNSHGKLLKWCRILVQECDYNKRMPEAEMNVLLADIKEAEGE